MQTKFLFIDAETDGLYGSFLTVGLVVTDDAGNMIEKAYYGIKKENMMISDVWTRENVFPVLGDYEACEDEAELLEKVWAFWMKYRGRLCSGGCDVPCGEPIIYEMCHE